MPANHDSAARLDPAQWAPDRLTVANLGHASVLMDVYGMRIVSDPTLFQRVGFAIDSIATIGPRRYSPPPLAPSQLQDVQVILITHAHMDHLDIPSLEALPKTAVVIACRKCTPLIQPLGFKDVRELRWGQATTVGDLRVTAMGAKHWGKRWPPWGMTYGFNSYVLERRGTRILLACDSAFTPLFSALAANPPEVAIFSNGSYDPWIWNHADPEEVWRMFLETHARYLIPIHWGTFRLSREPVDEPMHRLIAAAGDQSSRIVIRSIGGAWTMPESAPALHLAAHPAPPAK